MQRALLAMVYLSSALGTASAAVTVSGPATAVDGDSLEIGATEIRLYGVDAPEAGQDCGRGGTTWACGAAAKRKLAELAGRRTVRCEQRDIDDYGRMVAVCRRGSVDLGAEMVRSGLALAYRQYSNDYVDVESQARTARRGVWSGEFISPWEWRRGERNADHARRATDAGSTGSRRPSTQQSSGARAGCRIKGNINRRNERIYHVPGSRAYDATRIDERYGERWFCSEAEARAAGWRPPRSF